MKLSEQKGALLISGSRYQAKHKGQLIHPPFAEKVVSMAKERDWCIVCGDAVGVDETVIKTACENQIPVYVYGVAHIGLRLSLPNKFAIPVLIEAPRGKGCFIVRDKKMVKDVAALPKNGFLGLWNGESKGVQHTADAAIKANVPGILYLYFNGEHKMITRWRKKEESEFVNTTEK